MAGWLKQGLNTLGEGISTLTKEILAEEPPDHQGRSSNISQNAISDQNSQKNAFESLGSRAEIERLRNLVAEMEEKTSRTESLSSLKFHQMVHEYENVNAKLREKISDLENRLENFAIPQTTQNSGNQINGDPEIFRDVDLFSTSPSSNVFPVQTLFLNSSASDVFPVQTLSTSQSFPLRSSDSPNEERRRHLSHKDSSADSDLLEALEHELSEKDSTIRHLTQEISRSKTVIAEFESAISVAKSDVEIQTVEEETEALIFPSRSDQFIQSDESFLSDSQRESGIDASTMCEMGASVNDASTMSELGSSVNDASTMCEMRCSVNDEGVQADIDEAKGFIDTESQQFKVSETSVAEVQTETDPELVSTVETGIQFESETSDGQSQTDFLQESVPDSSEMAVQHDSEMEKIATTEQETQYDLAQENPVLPQSDAQIETAEATVQTADFSTTSQGVQSTAEVTDNGNQSEISGEITLFQDYARIVEESQELHSQLGTLSGKYDRSRKEIDRLRAHLLLVEQGFAQDFQLAQQREEDLKELVQQLESKVAFTEASDQSASQEIQEQAVSLQKEVFILTEARDLVVLKLHDAEKKNADLESSLSKLRLASEHIKMEHRAEIEQEKEKARKNFRNLENQIQDLKIANSNLELKLEELNKNLQISSKTIAEADVMKNQYEELLRQLNETSQLLLIAQNEAASIGKARVDIALMKNMLMGYLIGPKNCQPDILRMMMATLNFDEMERQKVQSNQTSTLRALFSSKSSEKGGHDTDDSFSNMLVKFIEQESKPKTAVNGIAEISKESPRKPSNSGPFNPLPSNTRLLNTQRSYTMAANATGRSNTATDPSMAQDRMLEDILNGPNDKPSRPSSAIDIV